jgi:hypothetical protein
MILRASAEEGVLVTSRPAADMRQSGVGAEVRVWEKASPAWWRRRGSRSGILGLIRQML